MTLSNAALVALPWQPFDHTSIQLGALTGWLRRAGHRVTDCHYYRDFIEYIGPEAWFSLHASSSGEALFAALRFPERRDAIRRQLAQRAPGVNFDRALEGADTFLDDLVAHHDWGSFDLIGVTTTHEQLVTSLAFAQRVKARHPGARFVFGGALLEERTGESLLSLFPEVDLVIFGEGERTLEEVASALGAGRSVDSIAGLVHRGPGGPVATPPRALLERLDELPLPDFTGYFAPGPRGSLASAPALVVEAARGCSWNRCSFCNLSVQWAGQLRRKSPERLPDEIEAQVRRYGSSRIVFADTNVSAYGDALGRVAERSLGLTIFAEVSAHLRRVDIEALHRAGLRSMQVGIEAFSDRLLERYHKGTSAMRNVEMLKWAAELGIEIGYNMIVRYPGDLPEDVVETARVMRYASVYSPPNLVDFSLSFDSEAFRNPAQHNVRGWEFPEFYREVYPVDVLRDLGRLLTLWVVPIPENKPASDWRPVEDLAAAWNARHEEARGRPRMTYRDSGSFLMVDELPARARLARSVRLRDLHRRVYLACDRESRSIEATARECEASPAEVEEVVRELDRLGILFHHRGRALALAIRER